MSVNLEFIHICLRKCLKINPKLQYINLRVKRSSEAEQKGSLQP